VRAKAFSAPNDFMSISTCWFGLWGATPENLGTDIGQTFKCSVVREPEVPVAKRIEQAEALMLDLHDQAFDAFTSGNFELEQALDARACVLRAQLSKWQKAAGMANVLVEDDEQ
jgi:hypothetical protein